MKNCGKIENQLSLYVDAALPPDEMGFVAKHLEGCESCMAQYQLLLQLTQDLKDLPEMDLPFGFHEEAMERIKSKEKNSVFHFTLPTRRVLNYATVFLFGVIMVGAVSIGIGFGIGARDNQPLQEGAVADSFPRIEARQELTVNDQFEVPSAAEFGVMYSYDDESSHMEDQLEESEINIFRETMDIGVEETTTDSGVYNGNALYETYSVDLYADNLQSAMNTVQSIDGIILQSSIHVDYVEEDRIFGQTSYYIQLDKRQFEEAKSLFSSLGDITNEYSNAIELSLEQDEVWAQLQSTEAELARLQDLLAKSDSLANMMYVNDRIADVTSALDYYKGRAGQLTAETDYTYMNVYLYSKNDSYVSPDMNFGARIAAGFSSSLKVVRLIFENLLVFIVYLFIPLLCIGVLAGVWYCINNTRKKRKV